MGEVASGDADAGIGDGQADGFIVEDGGYDYFAGRFIELDGIVDEIDYGLTDPVFVSTN